MKTGRPTVVWDDVTGTYMNGEQYRATYGEPRSVWIEDIPPAGEESDDCADRTQTPARSTTP